MKERLKKIVEIMCWDIGDGEEPQQAFARNGGNINNVPDGLVVDIVHAGGLQRWAESLKVSSQEQLYGRIMSAIRKTISDPIFNDRKRCNDFPPLYNFFIYCQRLDRFGKTHKEADTISEYVWNTVIVKRNLDENVRKMFSEAPDKEKYEAIAKRIKTIWGFSTKDIDAIRYFICQIKAKDLNPSLNKSLFIWGKAKQAGKSTVARAIATIMNGDSFDNFGKYESNLNTEMQYNDHDLPVASSYNCVILDEAMPKDSKKSYGLIKQMLTSNSCKYNQKFGAITRLKCNRNYIWISNDSIAEFIQDEKERRFYSINLEFKREEIDFDEIYDIWKEFCVNCQPDENWQEWYNSFAFVDGLATKDREEIVNEIVLQKDAIFGMGGGQISSVQVARKIFKNEPNREQKAATKAAMDLLFEACRAPSNPYIYNINQCRAKIVELEVNEEGGQVDEDLPF